MLGLTYTGSFVTDTSVASLQQKYANWDPYSALDPHPLNNEGKLALSFMIQLSNPIFRIYNIAIGQNPYYYP
jgi:hypothetical protein